jgi:putative DNA primase/helicase
MSAPPKPQAPRVTDPRMVAALKPFIPHVRWVLWRYEYKPDKESWTKVPKKLDGRNASNNDPSTWSPFLPIWNAYLAGRFDGVGLMLLGLSGIVAIDLDKIRDPDSGAVLPWVSTLIGDCASYCEVTPSMTGMRIIGAWPSGEKVHTNGPHPGGGRFEIFANCERYITVTGLANGSADDFADITPQTQNLLAVLQRKSRRPTTTGSDQPAILVENLSGWMRELVTEGKSDGRKVKQRGPQCFTVVRHLHKAGYSLEQVVDLAERFPDGVFGKYDGRLAEEVGRVWGKLDAPVLSNLPVLAVDPGKHEENARGALAALAEAPIYQRGGRLVQVVPVRGRAWDDVSVTLPAIVEVTKPLLAGLMSDAIYWQGHDKHGDPTRVSAPGGIVEMSLAMPDAWRFAVLRGVIGTPTLRRDGSVLIAAGYDPATGFVLYDPPVMPVMPVNPSKVDAAESLKLLDGLLAEFPFAVDSEKGETKDNNASRSVALSGFMTTVLRAAIDIVPLHALTTPTAGTGKSYLTDVCAMLAYGDRAAVLSQSSKEDETEKRLIAAALSGQPMIVLDNCGGALAGDFLCQVTERPVMKLRPLGSSTLSNVDNTFTTFANGNNLEVMADQVRRTIMCSMDANQENPEEREFTRSPLEEVRKDRGKYVAAVLTIARAYISEGSPDRRNRPSYDSWSHLVRSPLIWLGKADPIDTVAEIRTNDSGREQRAAVFAAWPAGGTEYTPADLIGHAVAYMFSDTGGDTALHGALMSVAAGKDGQINPDRLGRWLAKQARVVVGGKKLVRSATGTGHTTWMVVAKNPVSEPPF